MSRERAARRSDSGPALKTNAGPTGAREAAMSDAEVADSIYAIAIIGLAGRFPGASDVEAFWQNVQAGAPAISFFSDETLIAEGTDPALVRHPDYVKAKGVLDDADRFDAAFFGFNAREAEFM